MVEPNAPVAQWIEQRFPKPRALVQFRPGALPLNKPKPGWVQGLSTAGAVGAVSAWHRLTPPEQGDPWRGAWRG